MPETIYIRVEPSEIIKIKRSILSAEMHLLKAIKNLRQYKEIRAKELTKKADLKRRLRRLVLAINNLKQELPKVKMPSEVKVEEVEIFEKTKNNKLEEELKSIKEKLEMLEKD